MSDRPVPERSSLQSRAFGRSEQSALNREPPGLSYVGSALSRLICPFKRFPKRMHDGREADAKPTDNSRRVEDTAVKRVKKSGGPAVTRTRDLCHRHLAARGRDLCQDSVITI